MNPVSVTARAAEPVTIAGPRSDTRLPAAGELSRPLRLLQSGAVADHSKDVGRHDANCEGDPNETWLLLL